MINDILLKSMISERIWALLEVDPEQFKKEVREYFARGYPGYRVVSADPKKRIIYLLDERGERGSQRR